MKEEIPSLTSKYKIEYSLDNCISADDIADAVRLVLSSDLTVSEIRIIRKKMEVEYLVPIDRTPEDWLSADKIWDLDRNKADTVSELLSKIKMVNISSKLKYKINSVAIDQLIKIMMHCSFEKRSGIMWIIGDMDKFCKWLHVEPTPKKLLDLPIVTVNSIGNDNIILLAGKSYRVNPKQADMAFVCAMV